jgi:cytochrome bd-type quinol oxidase subunit 1
MMNVLFRISRVFVVIGGVTVLLLAFLMWLQFLLVDLSTRQADSGYVWFFLLLVGPGIIVVVGALLQIVRRKPWAVLLVLIGGVGNVVFVGLNVHFVFAYTGDKRGLLEVYTDLVVMGLTFVAAFFNLFSRDSIATAVSNNSLDASGGGVLPK